MSMEQALEADGETVPAGSADFEREPMRLDAGQRRGAAAARRGPPTAAAPTVRPSDRPATRAMSDLDAKLAEVARQYDDLQAELALPGDVARSRPRSGGSARSWRGSSRSSRRSGGCEATRAELAGARELRDGATRDDEMRAMAARRDRPARGRRDAAARGAQGPAAAARPERRPRRDPGDPGRRRRRGGRPVRGRAATGCTSATPSATASRPSS